MRNGILAAVAFLLGVTATPNAYAADPYAGNNGFLPSEKEWSRPFRMQNYQYPQNITSQMLEDMVPLGVQTTVNGKTVSVPITKDNAASYLAKLHKHVTPTLRAMFENPHTWQPTDHNWYNLLWLGASSPSSQACEGREVILGSMSGQVILEEVFAEYGLTVAAQNFAVIYYNDIAATALRRLFANPYKPDLTQAKRSGPNGETLSLYPEGSIIVKAGAVTATTEQWPVLEGAAEWNVYRPQFDKDTNACNPKSPPEVQPLRALQFDIIIKDSIASPETGWVFSNWVHNPKGLARNPDATPWELLTVLGAQWGNDPKYANKKEGTGPNGELEQSWINPQAPAYAKSSLGWGHRLSGPIDIGERHNVVHVDGTRKNTVRASSCMGCHSTAQFPFSANLYPSPNRSFPPEGDAFMLYMPGSPQWARWNQNRRGYEAFNAHRQAVGLDYDMAVMFAIGNAYRATGQLEYAIDNLNGH